MIKFLKHEIYKSTQYYQIVLSGGKKLEDKMLMSPSRENITHYVILILASFTITLLLLHCNEYSNICKLYNKRPMSHIAHLSNTVSYENTF
jgi:ASC-1-like (ASCH) protein